MTEDLDPQGRSVDEARDRDRDLASRPLTADSLKGSYFRREVDDEIQEGMIVGEAFVGTQGVDYMVEFYELHSMRDGSVELVGAGYQEIIGLDQMKSEKWKFFDTRAWLMARYYPASQPKSEKELKRDG